VPDYFDIIDKPMDLGTVRSKLDKSEYTTAAEVISDLHLTFDNAMQYNPETDKVYACAAVLKSLLTNLVDRSQILTKAIKADDAIKKRLLGQDADESLCMTPPTAEKIAENLHGSAAPSNKKEKHRHGVDENETSAASERASNTPNLSCKDGQTDGSTDGDGNRHVIVLDTPESSPRKQKPNKKNRLKLGNSQKKSAAGDGEQKEEKSGSATENGSMPAKKKASQELVKKPLRDGETDTDKHTSAESQKRKVGSNDASGKKTPKTPTSHSESNGVKGSSSNKKLSNGTVMSDSDKESKGSDSNAKDDVVVLDSDSEEAVATSKSRCQQQTQVNGKSQASNDRKSKAHTSDPESEPESGNSESRPDVPVDTPESARIREAVALLTENAPGRTSNSKVTQALVKKIEGHQTGRTLRISEMIPQSQHEPFFKVCFAVVWWCLVSIKVCRCHDQRTWILLRHV
jgi:hypothetical protein